VKQTIRLNLIFSSLLLLCLSACLCGYFFAHQVLAPAEPAMHISCASLILDGWKPYIDFLDNSSPLTLYLFTLPALLSRICYLHPILIFNLLFVLLTIVVFIPIMISTAYGGFRTALVSLYLPALVAAVACCQTYFIKDFGQENMMFSLLFLPYLLERYLSRVGAERRHCYRQCFAGFLAALAVLLNPVFLLALPVVEFICLIDVRAAISRRIRRHFFNAELTACLVSLVVLSLLISLMAPTVVAAYCGPILSLNLLSFDYFYDTIAFVDKSPDRRDLIFAFVMFFIVSLPASSRCLLVRLFCTMSILGFVWLICSGTLFSHQAICMIFFSFSAFSLALCRYLRSMRSSGFSKSLNSKLCQPLRKKCISAANFLRARRKLQPLTLAFLLLSCFATTSYLALKKLPTDQYFALNSLNYYGFGLKQDLSFFSDVLEKNSAPKDLVWIFSGQARPGFPLLTQLRRQPGYLVWAFPVHTLRIMHERAQLSQIKDLQLFETNLFKHLRSELNSVRPPTLILIEEEEVWQALKAAKINDLIAEKYDLLETTSPLSEVEKETHAPYEYIGHRLGFTSYKLRR